MRSWGASQVNWNTQGREYWMQVGKLGSDVRREGERTIAVSLTPQTEHLKAHQEEEGTKGAQCGPKSSQELGTRTQLIQIFQGRSDHDSTPRDS